MEVGLPPDRFRSWVAFALFLRAMQQTTKYKTITNRIHRRAESIPGIRYPGITKIHMKGIAGNRTELRVLDISEQPTNTHRRRFSVEESGKCRDRRSVAPIQTNCSVERLSIEP